MTRDEWMAWFIDLQDNARGDHEVLMAVADMGEQVDCLHAVRQELDRTPWNALHDMQEGSPLIVPPGTWKRLRRLAWGESATPEKKEAPDA